jgi:hypothetical protein
MQRVEVSVAVRPIYGSLGVKRLISKTRNRAPKDLCRVYTVLWQRTEGTGGALLGGQGWSQAVAPI